MKEMSEGLKGVSVSEFQEGKKKNAARRAE